MATIELHETCDGNRWIFVIIIIIDDDHKIVITIVVALDDLVPTVHGDHYVANSDIRLRSINLTSKFS